MDLATIDAVDAYMFIKARFYGMMHYFTQSKVCIFPWLVKYTFSA